MNTIFKSHQINLDELVFKTRNKSYGAYQLRVHYKDEITKALLITFALFVFITGLVFYEQQLNQTITEKFNNVVSDPHHITQVTVPLKPVGQPMQNHNQINTKLPPVITKDSLVTTVKKDTAAVGNPGDGKGKFKTTDSTNNSLGVVKIKEPQHENKPFHWAEKMPSYPGGDVALMKFLKTHIVFPKQAQNESVNGKVILSFVVGTDGLISEIKVMKDEVGFGCAEAAIKAVSEMPKWEPGIQNGNTVPVWYNLPVSFQSY